MKWYQKKELWGLLSIVGAILTVIPGTQIIGVAVTTGVGTAMSVLGVKDGLKNDSSTKLVNFITDKKK